MLGLLSDLGSAASLSVSPDRAQHFTTATASLSLSCSGNSSTWMVKRFSLSGYLTHCAPWGSMTGHACNLTGSQISDGVYWCETATGRFSNAVNITGSCECLFHQFSLAVSYMDQSTTTTTSAASLASKQAPEDVNMLLG